MSTSGVFRHAGALTIPSGTTLSNILAGASLGSFVSLLLSAPPTLDALTYTIEVHPLKTATAASSGWCTLVDSAGTPIAPPAAATARRYDDLPLAGSLRIRASGNVSAAKAFQLTGVVTV